MNVHFCDFLVLRGYRIPDTGYRVQFFLAQGVEIEASLRSNTAGEKSNHSIKSDAVTVCTVVHKLSVDIVNGMLS